jgi:hypothetical protein
VKFPLALLLGVSIAGFRDDGRLEFGRTFWRDRDGGPHRLELTLESDARRAGRAARPEPGSLHDGAHARGLPPSQALREAKLAIRRSRSTRGIAVSAGASDGANESGHPYYWAPFIHIGLPR